MLSRQELIELKHQAAVVTGVSQVLIRQTADTLRRLKDALRSPTSVRPPSDPQGTGTEMNTPSAAPAVCRVLVVDDNRDVADITGDLFAVYGFDVRVCYDAADALTAADDFLLDVAILDLCMPGMSGDELARRLRAKARDRPLVLIAVTALGSDEARRQVAEAGFDGHLIKPVPADQLLATVADPNTRPNRSPGETIATPIF